MKKKLIFIQLFGLIAILSLANDKHNVKDYDIVGNGTTLNTKQIQLLIDKVNEEGGGTITFPKGRYLTGSLQLKSNVHLHFEKAAVLLGSTNPYDYEDVQMPGRPRLGSRDDNAQMALLVAFKAHHFSISGKGCIDGQGRELALNIDSLHHIGEQIDPKYNTRRMRPHETARPKLFRFSMCSNINISGTELKNSACWGLSFELCHNLKIENVKILNRAFWNNDGMDITDCRNVSVTNCEVNSADDGICLKSYYPDHANDSIYIANCTIRTSASAVKFGTASYGGFKNVKIENIKVYDTFRSAIAIESVDGGNIENIEVSNIIAENTGNPIFIRLGHRAGEKPGTIKNVYLHDIKVQVPFRRPDIDYDMRGPAVNFFHNPFPSSIAGIPGHDIENVRIENVEITHPGRASKGMAYVPLSRLEQVPEQIKDYPEFHMFGELPSWAFYVRHVKNISFKNVTLKLNDSDFRPPFIFDDVSGVKMEKLTLPVNNKKIVIKNVQDIDVDKALEKQISRVPYSSGKELTGLVYPQLDTENSRWFFFSSACRPFGMVNLSPDTQIGGAWGSGYRYKTDTVKGFSHIHAWQLSGLSVMPVALTQENKGNIFTDFYSHFSHQTEKVSPGYQFLNLNRYNIDAEITSTKRVGFHKYTFNANGKPALLLNLNTLLGPCQNVNGVLHKTGKNFVAGELTNAPTRRRPKPTKVFFKIESDTEIVDILKDEKTGNYLLTFNETTKQVQLKAGISYTSVENANNNIQKELPHWNFKQVVKESQKEWDSLLGRIQVKGGTEKQQKRFYTDLWHALQGRRIISDANGAYPDYTDNEFRIGQIPLDENGKPKFNHYNSDSFWGAQWTLNTLWGLAYPEVYKEFVQSMMLYYADGGMIPRGPSGGNYTYVMTGASATPFIVSAIQKGIVTTNLEKIYRALKKGHVHGGIMAKAGYEHDTELGGGLDYYIKNGYVPYPIPEGNFGYHQDGASLTMEYAYQDWTLAQLAKKLDYKYDYDYFIKRSENYKNVYDPKSTWMRPKDINGNWLADFDPYKYEHGFNESNGAQSTWFVPHDLNGLAELMGGTEKAVEKLNQQFETAEKLNFTSGTSHDKEQHPEYRRIPINYGNQPSIQTAFIFHELGRPDLSQYWVQQIVDKAFSGLSPQTGYNGDEDQGLMGSLSVLMKIGLFQMTGGTEHNPAYQVGCPIFDEVSIQLQNGKTFVIKKQKATENNTIKRAIFNGSELETLNLNHEELTKGGMLIIK